MKTLEKSKTEFFGNMVLTIEPIAGYPEAVLAVVNNEPAIWLLKKDIPAFRKTLKALVNFNYDPEEAE